MRYSKTRNVKSPSRGTAESAGIDFFVPNDFVTYSLGGGERILIPSGIHVEVPKGYALIAFNKSGIASKKGLSALACVVDSDYQGEVHLSLVNTSDYGYVDIKPGDKILQFILLPVNFAIPEECPFDELYPKISERGAGGFGSTGEK